MSKYLFLYRLKDIDDRDCCAYIEAKNPRFECGHYFGSVTLHGSCYSGHTFAKYEDIETVLTESEYKELIAYNNAIKDLGYGIKEGDNRYQKGIELGNKIQHIYDKLNSDEATEFQKSIIESEVEYMKDEYSLSDEDVEQIFNEYYLDYRDRSIICCIFNDTSDAGYEEAFSLGYIKNGDTISERYFDYEKFGKDLLEDEEYMELSDGRVVRLNY
jgi:hypothetical protein